MQLDRASVRLAMLGAQGLLSSPGESALKQDLLPCIWSMGYLQIDTIQVIHRSQYLVLWSRLGDFNPAWLDEVHAEGSLFEYHAHALCYLPIEDYPIFRGLMLFDDRVGNDWREWASRHPQVIERVRAVIEEKGPVCSADFDSPAISTDWGNAKQEKLALIQMWSAGDLMVPYRENFRRYFDLRERVLPSWDDTNALNLDEAYRALILRAVKALGVASVDWIAAYYYLRKGDIHRLLVEMIEKKQLVPVEVQGWEESFYLHPDQYDLVLAAASGDLAANHTTLLSPFDPLISDRSRTKSLFDYEYSFEAYTPVKKRQYGYFCLPILYQGKLVGRLDPKAHRKQSRMEIKFLHLEPGIEIDDALISTLKETLIRFTKWHGLDDLTISRSSPSTLMDALA